MENNKKVIETFKKIGPYEEGKLIHTSPSCFNGKVRVRKYRITIEVIEEPIEVIQERIQTLWDENTNHHHYQPLKKAGEKYGMELS